MAHYRKLVVNGKEYQYNIGKRFVAIKSDTGTEHVEKSKVGFHRYEDRYVVTPKMVRDYITGELGTDPANYFPSCDCVGVEKKLTVNPFKAEIHERILYRVLCDDCYQSIADNI